jgi:hypothetical protein
VDGSLHHKNKKRDLQVSKWEGFVHVRGAVKAIQGQGEDYQGAAAGYML